MLKFFHKHPPKDSHERTKLKKELFGYQKCLDHGFPSKPSCMAFDPKLQLLAIGTKQGRITVYGQPGIELSAEIDTDATINQLFFIREEGRLLSVCSDNTIYLWEINVRKDKTVLENAKSFVFGTEEGKNKNISVCSLSRNEDSLLIGTEIGNIYTLNVASFTLSDQVVHQDVVMQNVPDDFKVNPGAVEAIAVHPTDPHMFLIGYNRGLIVLWDKKECCAEKTFTATQQLESLCWNRKGRDFMSAHNDGSYIVWDCESAEPKDPALTPYGPFPCKAIGKLSWKSSKRDNFIIFTGGMPRASYGDRHTISVMQGDNNVVFDFTTKVIDFVVMTRSDENDVETEDNERRDEYDEPHALIALVEEEIVVIDLDTSTWPTFRLPYLNSLHSSAITCSQHVNNIPEQLWQKIVDAGDAQHKDFSQRPWPINGGNLDGVESRTKDLLITGHEDGSVKFWDASGVSMSLLYKLSTAELFSIDIHSGDNGELEEEWPPFRKVGTFDPFSDDPRLGIQKICLCPLSETLVVAGTAGQVMVLQMEREERQLEIPHVMVNIVQEKDTFAWKGHEALPAREGEGRFSAGFQPASVMQLYPPAACTALAFHSEWQLVTAGTAHGFALFDYARKVEVSSRCTLNAADMSGTSDTPMSRRKSLKKSLRESFRRLRRGRSERRKNRTKKEGEGKEGVAGTGIEEPRTSPPGSPEHRPVERQVEARSTEDSMASMVRCVYFADTFITSHGPHNPSLWVGTNGGQVLIYNLTVPSEKRTETAVSCIIAKEIKLRHKAPVIGIGVFDGRARLLPDALEVQHERAKSPEMSGQHNVIICSEEQLKIFTLPNLKARKKFKVTATNGARLRKVAFVNFRSKSDENYSEVDIVSLSNLGDLTVHLATTLTEQLSASVLRREDINGISSFCFTRHGQGFFLVSSSEYIRVTLSARSITEANFSIHVKGGMRIKSDPEPKVAENDSIPKVTVTGPTDTEQDDQDDQLSSQRQYDSGDLTEALNESQLNDSRADTTTDMEVTQDSIQVTEPTNEIPAVPTETTAVPESNNTQTVTVEITAGGGD